MERGGARADGRRGGAWRRRGGHPATGGGSGDIPARRHDVRRVGGYEGFAREGRTVLPLMLRDRLVQEGPTSPRMDPRAQHPQRVPRAWPHLMARQLEPDHGLGGVVAAP